MTGDGVGDGLGLGVGEAPLPQAAAMANAARAAPSKSRAKMFIRRLNALGCTQGLAGLGVLTLRPHGAYPVIEEIHDANDQQGRQRVGNWPEVFGQRLPVVAEQVAGR